VEDNRRPEPDEIRRASGAGANAGDSHGATDTTQTFGHDSDLSFVPFGLYLFLTIPRIFGWIGASHLGYLVASLVLRSAAARDA